MLRAMVTPWFAAGAGVLIAATILLESPGQAVLSYGPPLDPGIKCRYQGCTGGPGGNGALTTTRHAPKLPKVIALGHGHGHASRKPQVSVAGVTVSFREHRHGHAGFVGVITLTSSRRALGEWQLSFRVPGARIIAVQGASWQPNQAGDGGIASWTGSGPGGSSPGGPSGLPGGPGPGGGGQDGNSQGGPAAVVQGNGPGMTAQIVFFAVGTPPSGQLADCLFDGDVCTLG